MSVKFRYFLGLATLAWSHYLQESEFVLAATDSTSTLPSSYAVAGAFPTSLYSHYYNNPTATSAQPQPVISDPVTHEIFPFSLTDPQDIPQYDTEDPHPLPSKASSQMLLQQAVAQIKSIAVNPMFSTCARCQASLEVAKFLALAAPEQGTNLALTLCEYFNYSSSCEKSYGPLVLGPILTQVASLLMLEDMMDSQFALSSLVYVQHLRRRLSISLVGLQSQNPTLFPLQSSPVANC
jgi:hypothetical protein